jgi:valyl-tRNA synthetase
MNLEDYQEIGAAPSASLPDRWIKSRLNRAVADVVKSFDEYRFNDAAAAIYQFIWHELCDWYLELVKPYLYQDQDARRRAITQETLFKVFDATLKVLHPFMPFITEEIWQSLPGNKESDSIMVAKFPEPDQRFDDDGVADEMGLVIEVVTALRTIRGEMNVPPGEQIRCILRTKDAENENRIRRNQSFIQNLARVKEITIGEGIEKPPHSAYTLVRNMEIVVPMDRSRMEEEAKRLQKEIVKVEKEIAFVGKKLLNEQFLAKAPAEVVEEEKAKASEFRTRREKLEENLKRIKEALG